jgi:hypothetical protein
MITATAVFFAWAVVSIAVGLLVGSMCRTSRQREYVRQPLASDAEARVARVLRSR